MRITETTPDALKQMAGDTETAADELATARVDVILYAYTSGSFLEGPQWEYKLKERISNVSGGKALTNSGAIVGALQGFGVRSVSLATPYIDELNRLEVQFLASQGFTAVESEGLGIVENVEISRQAPDVSFRLVKRVVME